MTNEGLISLCAIKGKASHLAGANAGDTRSNAQMDCSLPGVQFKGEIQDEHGPGSCCPARLLHQPGLCPVEDV